MIIKPFSTLFRFKYYSTQEEYMSDWGVIPVYDDAKPPKYWFDPAARVSTQKLIEYKPTLFITENGTIGREKETDTFPKLDSIVLTREDAGRVNIPPKLKPGEIRANFPADSKPEVPMPLLPVPAGWEIYFQFGGNLALRDISPQVPIFAGEGFTEADRQLLKDIYSKLRNL